MSVAKIVVPKCVAWVPRSLSDGLDLIFRKSQIAFKTSQVDASTVCGKLHGN